MRTFALIAMARSVSSAEGAFKLPMGITFSCQLAR